ncbi:MAG: RNA polymerase sigma factor [Gammaproteobacteria bacterium]|nr:RNA polymerase sigma factor [Gammaproteobacteria bacterium]MDH3767884.1 RNA polymerase sigma factor [Gammaproteobacteria bacterium]
MAATDESLISRAIVDHDTQAFDELVQRHQSRVRGWLRHLAGDPALADDLAQETFLRAWKKIATYKAKGSFEAWLLTIARNEFLQNKRKSGRETGHLERLQAETTTDNSESQEYHGEGADADRFLEILGPDERDIMILVYGIGLSHNEASHVSGLPLGTVKSHVRRGVLKVREKFGVTGR